MPEIKNRKEFISKPYLIGITGNFGSGKSTIGKILSENDFCVVDTDDIVDKMLSYKNSVTNEIRNIFGDEVVITDSPYYINKKKLAEIIFNDSIQRKALEKIIHPEVEKCLEEFYIHMKDEKTIFILIPLLFECNLEKKYHEIWCITCEEKTRISRLENKGLDLNKIQKRLNSQMAESEKCKRSDLIINNSGSIENTKQQIWLRLKDLSVLVRH